MEMLWAVSKWVAWIFSLNLLFRWSFGLLFLMARKPFLWILFLTVLAVFPMWIVYIFDWNPVYVGGAVLVVMFLNPTMPKRNIASSEEQAEAYKEFFSELGIENGIQKKRVGLVAYIVFSILSYVIFFTEECNQFQECTRVIDKFL